MREEGRERERGGQPRERGWDRVDEWGRKKNKHVEILAVTHFVKRKKKSRKRQKTRANTRNKRLNNIFEATFKLFCISSLGKYSNGLRIFEENDVLSILTT